MSPWHRYASRFSRPRRLMAWAVLAALARVATLVPIPLLVERTLSQGRSGDPWTELAISGFAVLLLQALGGLIHLQSRARVHAAVREVTAELREEGLRKLLALGPLRAEAHGSADLHDGVVHETERIDAAGRVVLAELLPGAAATAGLALALLAFDARLVLALVVLVPPFVLSERRLAPALRVAAAQRNRAYLAFSQAVLQGLRGLGLVHAHGAGAWLLERQRGVLLRLTVASGRALELAERGRGVQQALVGLGSTAMLVAGALAVARAELTLEELAGFFAGLALLRGPASAVLSSLPPLAEADTSLRSLFDLLDAPEPPAGGLLRLEEFDGRVELRGVAFAWGERTVLREVDLVVGPGQCVAIVGPIGAGKSTLLRLLAGLIQPTAGTAFAGGHDQSELDLPHLRGRIGYMSQDPVLLPGSLRDNITFGRPEATADAVDEAVRLAGLDAWLGDLPGGLEAPAGEEGARLSGGQRQQLALSRALLARPALLLLDEPTNHLSRAASRALLERLDSLAWTPAIVMASHDLEVAQHADVVRHLANGRLLS